MVRACVSSRARARECHIAQTRKRLKNARETALFGARVPARRGVARFVSRTYTLARAPCTFSRAPLARARAHARAATRRLARRLEVRARRVSRRRDCASRGASERRDERVVSFFSTSRVRACVSRRSRAAPARGAHELATDFPRRARFARPRFSRRVASLRGARSITRVSPARRNSRWTHPIPTASRTRHPSEITCAGSSRFHFAARTTRAPRRRRCSFAIPAWFAHVYLHARAPANVTSRKRENP